MTLEVDIITRIVACLTGFVGLVYWLRDKPAEAGMMWSLACFVVLAGASS